MLDRLPPELLSLILDQLPLHSDVVRPRSALVPLLSVSSALRRFVEPLLNATIELRSLATAQAFVSVDHAVGPWVTKLVLHRLAGEQGRSWADVVGTLLAAPTRTGLLELSVAAGVDSVQALAETLRLACGAGGAGGAGLGDALLLLSLDFEELPWTAREALAPSERGIDYPGSLGGSVDGSGSTSSLLDACLRFPNLARLSVRLPRQPLTLSPCAVSRLKHLELKLVTLSDATLGRIASSNRTTLANVALVDIDGCTAQGLKAAVGQLECLRSLRFEAPIDLTRPHSPPPSGSPPSSPLRRPSLPPSSPSSPPTSPFSTLLDEIVPLAPHLVHLSLSGPVCSHALPGLLASGTPSLESLTLSPHSPLNPASIITLVLPASTRLPSLRRVRLDIAPRAASLGAGASDARELWGAATNGGVVVMGNVFDSVTRMIRWGEQMGAREAAEVEEAPRPPRKRPGVARY